jgi:hypothetical protein
MKHHPKNKNNQEKRLQLFVTQKEYKSLMAVFANSDLHSISAFLRKKVVGNGVIIPDATHIKNKLDEIGYQYERIGNNINQVARKVNLYHKKGHFPANELAHYNEIIQQYLKVTEELSKSFRVFLRELARK